MIAEPETRQECLKSLMAIRDSLDAISGKWKLQIIIAVWAGNKRFKDIERQIPNISPRMLSKELKDLEEQKLLKRNVYDTLPVTIEYTATQHAESLRGVISVLRDWGIEHRKVIIGR
ncbi:winged helix-turn-helix transcriptional regulator [Flavobacterium sp. '19STA2R22 D10 B1']|uniref:winged helix-turn-helix transcriptional regulator n=1 Tax=Flavobacterium aerium TaxID=3037261 RepID=UPI00278C5EC0|nr:helix-turn-helix domain-containing protein [Flavobacterium sp. '19STA2R22 D10 B1']